MDPRHISTLAFSTPTDEERERPFMWRYWRALPPKGKIGIFAGSWYSQPIADRIGRRMKRAEMEETLDEINRFEAMLVNEGALVLKFWFHLSKEGQKARLKALEKDPRTAWRVTRASWDRLKTHDELQDVAGHVLRVTNTAHAPWTIIEGTDDNYRSLTVGHIVRDAIRKHLDAGQRGSVPVAPPMVPAIDRRTVLSELDLTQKLDKKVYERELAKWQGKLSQLMRDPRFLARHSLIVAFEGSDAAGKGGAIRRIAAAMDARQFQIVPVAAPTDEERAQPYLWRFWRHIPRRGRLAIFDRSWYGRVLVERVEGFCKEADWMRAYSEINDFEQQLTQHNVLVVKFWLATSKEEQYRRFKEREKVAFKRFKITAEDWRNRKKWDQYETAVCDMVDRTSTNIAPWTLVEANNKYYARVKVLRTLVEALEAALERIGKADKGKVKKGGTKKSGAGKGR
jgi:polyphosphate:AMP phosphotransferase